MWQRDSEQRMPNSSHTRPIVMCMEFSVTFSSFPIPEVHLPEPIPWNNVLAVWTEINFACVSRVVMADECLICNLTDFIPTRVNHNCPAKNGCTDTEGMQCIAGSAMYFIGTGISCHRLWTQISSHRQRMWQYYMAGGDDCIPGILHGWRWWLYSWHICPVLMSHW